MGDLFTDTNALFMYPAVVGTVFFLFRIVLMMMGGFGDADVDAPDIDLDVDVDVGDGDAGHLDSTDAFEVLSIQGIAAFLMGFGWGGLVGLKTLQLELGYSMLVGAGFGVALMYLLAWMMSMIYSLQSSGNVNIRDAVGKTGDVYATVPPRGEGRGQVRIVINGQQRIFNAITEGEAIPSKSRITITKANDDNTLTVCRA